MKKILCLSLMILFLISPAMAWEFKTTGYYEFQYNYISRIGPNDLFGNVERAQANTGVTSIGLSAPIAGIVVPEGLSSKGSAGAWTQEKLTFFPTMIISPAVRLNTIISFQGTLNGPYVGGPNWATPIHRWGSYLENSRSTSIYDPVAVPFLRAAWIEAQIPWGRLEFGRRPFGFGLGWAGFHKEDLANTALALTVPYGPLSMIAGFVLHDSGEQTDPYDSRNVNLTPRTVASFTDTLESRHQNWYAGLTYQTGPLDTGFLFRMVKYHRVHALPFGTGTLRDDQTASFAAQFLTATSSNSAAPIYGDVSLLTVPIYLKYYNGRFFFNAEYAFQWLQVERQGGRPIGGNPKAWMVEAGASCGPGKLTLGGFYRSGDDREGGIFNVSTATATNTPVPTSDSWNQYIGGAAGPLEPYNWLIGWYGTGNNSYDATGRPQYLDFKGFAARLDYAVASNMNWYLTYLYARRASNTGSWFGQYNGGVGTPVVPATSGSVNNVADTNLGWEANIGTSWKLLEGLTWDVQAAYWKPLNWWKQAYQDLALVSTATGGANAIQGTGDRNIDPLIGIRTTLRIDF